MRAGSGIAPAKASSHSVWTKSGTRGDKNGCMVNKIGNFPNLVDIYYKVYPGILMPKSGVYCLG